MTFGELMERLNSVWVGNEAKLKDVRVRISGAGCVFDIEGIAPDLGAVGLILGDKEFVRTIWPRMKAQYDRERAEIVEKRSENDTGKVG